MRRSSGVSRPISAKPDTCMERRDVYPTGISVTVRAQYPGRSGGVPCATDIERCWDAPPEVSRGHGVRRAARCSGGLKSLWCPDEGRHIRKRG